MEMPTRAELHKLVDSLPDGAVETAHRSLSHLRVWPPPPVPSMVEMRRRMEDRRREWQQRHKAGTLTGFTGGGNYNPTDGTGSYSMQYWDGDTFVSETLRNHKGHELTVIERIRIEDQHLLYKHEVTGPGEKHDEREVVFDVAA